GRRPSGNVVLQHFGWTLVARRSAGLADGVLDAGRRHVVEALEIHEIAGSIDDGDGDVPAIAPRFGCSGRTHRLGALEGEILALADHLRRCRRGECERRSDGQRRQPQAAAHDQIPPMQRYLISRNSSSPYFDPSRPRPDSFTPPNGATSVEMIPVLRPTMPYSSASATRQMRPMSRP